MSIFYLAAAYGLAWIWKESDLFATTRNWLMQRSTFITQLLSCWYCTGFWAGAFIYVLQHASVVSFETFNPFEWIIWGCAGSAAAALGNAVIDKMTLTPMNEENKE
jgi:hypothetical protein